MHAEVYHPTQRAPNAGPYRNCLDGFACSTAAQHTSDSTSTSLRLSPSKGGLVTAIDRLDLAQIRAAGARALRSAPTVAAIGPVAKAFTPDRVAQRLRGI